ncbi:Na+/proline symporter [gamma proteobacterium HIMB55]|nr:Na+/proline symporter [gamma proteobacterium HIMB55]
MTAVDNWIVVLYLMGILAVGLRASRGVSSSQDFAVAGQGLSFPLLLGTLIAAVVGASATIGRAGKAYEVGILIALSGVAYGLGLLAFGKLAPVIKRIQFWSVPDALGARYGQTFRFLSALIIYICVIGVFASQLMAFGVTATFMSESIEVSFTHAVMISALLMTAYTLTGGMKSVAAADLFQVVIIVVMIGVVLPVVLMGEMGGPVSAVKALAPLDGDWLGGMSVVFLVSLFLIDIPIVLIDASLWQKTGAAQNAGHIRRAVIITGLAFIVWGTLSAAYGVLAKRLDPGLIEAGMSADGALPSLLFNYMPPVLLGLAFAALVAVIISTAATAMLVAGTTAGFELFKVIKPVASDKETLLVTRLGVALVALLGVYIALNAQGVFDLLLLTMAVYVSGIFIPTMCALFWSKATTKGATAASLGGGVSVVILYGLQGAGKLPSFLEPIIGGLLVSGALMYLVSQATYDSSTTTARLVDRAVT